VNTESLLISLLESNLLITDQALTPYRMLNSDREESGDCSYIGNYEGQKILDPA
jgi:hypothetical protein